MTNHNWLLLSQAAIAGLIACALSATAFGQRYAFRSFRFPDPPRTVVGVKYRAGDAQSAMPLGGLGTGTIAFDSRGQFAGHSITNTYRPVAGGMPGCGFDIAAATENSTAEQSLAELTRSYLGHFPMADLECAKPGFPVTMNVRAMSPFVLGDARTSGTPAAMFRFELRNTSGKPVTASVKFAWRTPVQAAGGGGGVSAQGNVDGFLVWDLGDLEPGATAAVPVIFAAADSTDEARARLEKPSGDLVVDDDGAFNWEDGGKQCLTTRAGGCLSQHGFSVHYNDGEPRGAGTAIVGAPRLENLVRAGRTDDVVSLSTTDGTLTVDVSKGDGVLEYRICNAGDKPVRDLQLAVYANLEAGHTEMDDRGWLDPELGALIIADDSGAACALAGERRPDGGWCGLWGSTIGRMKAGEAIAIDKWAGAQEKTSTRRTVVAKRARGVSVTREETRDCAGCTLVALGGAGVTTAATSDGDSPEDIGVTSSVKLKPGESREVRFVLAWFYPDARDSDGKSVGHQYANWFDGSQAVAEYVTAGWSNIARRVGEWQERIYTETTAPAWLKDQAVNSLYAMVRNSSWLKDGRFTQSESFIGCPITETIVCRFYGSIPLAMFFPDLERNTMRQFMRHQRADGAIPFAFGGGERWDAPYYETQQIIDSTEFVLMAWRDYAWWRDRAWADEVYPAVKRSIAFARTLDTDGDGLINDELSRQYYDCWQFYGASSYTDGIWLAALKAAIAFARLEDDEAFAAECEALLAAAQPAFEQQLWTGSYYRLWNDPAKNARSDTCLAAQLTGQWYAYLCGLGEVLPHARIITALEHVSRANGAGDVWALVNGIMPDGSRDTSGTNGHSQTATLGETWCYAATCVYAGRPELGLPRAERLAQNIALRQRRSWDTTWNLNPDTGEMLWGNEYYSDMCVWDLWSALVGRRGLDGK
jgi:uncharacterized protein (DUF608 family)